MPPWELYHNLARVILLRVGENASQGATHAH